MDHIRRIKHRLHGWRRVVGPIRKHYLHAHLRISCLTQQATQAPRSLWPRNFIMSSSPLLKLDVPFAMSSKGTKLRFLTMSTGFRAINIARVVHFTVLRCFHRRRFRHPACCLSRRLRGHLNPPEKSQCRVAYLYASSIHPRTHRR